VIIVVLGILLIIAGAIMALVALLKFLSILALPFHSEKRMDKKLFSIWEKEKDYENFKNKIDKL